MLEAFENKWTILDVLAQPEAWLDDVLYVKSLGTRVASQMRRKKASK